MKTQLEFPCHFPLKAIGTGVEDFEALVVEVVRQHVPELDASANTRRLSAGGKYLAVTLYFVAQSQAQLDAIYTDLRGHSRVVMLL